MTNEEAIARIKEHKIIHKMNEPRAIYISEALDMAIKALEQEPCEDVVSRNAIIQTLNNMDRYVANELILCDTNIKFPQNEVFIVDDVYEQIAEQLPSVTPQPKTGRWIKSTGYDNRDHFYTCSECGRNINLICGAKLTDYPYCHCGAKMEVNADENSN